MSLLNKKSIYILLCSVLVSSLSADPFLSQWNLQNGYDEEDDYSKEVKSIYKNFDLDELRANQNVRTICNEIAQDGWLFHETLEILFNRIKGSENPLYDSFFDASGMVKAYVYDSLLVAHVPSSINASQHIGLRYILNLALRVRCDDVESREYQKGIVDYVIKGLNDSSLSDRYECVAWQQYGALVDFLYNRQLLATGNEIALCASGDKESYMKLLGLLVSTSNNMKKAQNYYDKQGGTFCLAQIEKAAECLKNGDVEGMENHAIKIIFKIDMFRQGPLRIPIEHCMLADFENFKEWLKED